MQIVVGQDVRENPTLWFVWEAFRSRGVWSALVFQNFLPVRSGQVRNLGMAHRVLRELRLLRELAHDNVVTLYGVPNRWLERSEVGDQRGS